MNQSAKLAGIGYLTLALGTLAMSAEIRDVGNRLDSVQALQSSGETTRVTAEDVAVLVARAMQLGENSSLGLKVERPLPLNLGRTLRFVQTYKGVPIWNAEVVVDQDADGRIVGIDGSAVFDIGAPDESGQPKLSSESALALAKELTAGSASRARAAKYQNEEARLVYYLDGKGDLRLSYYTTFSAHVEDDGGVKQPTRPVYIIDAKTRETLDFYENSQSAAPGRSPGRKNKSEPVDTEFGVAGPDSVPSEIAKLFAQMGDLGPDTIAAPTDMPPEIAEMLGQTGGSAGSTDVAASEEPQEADAPEAGAVAGDRYLFTTLRVISKSSARGCGYANWNCMTRLCKRDLNDTAAWRGWAGCWKGDSWICYFECGQRRSAF